MSNAWNTITDQIIMSRFSDGEKAALSSLQSVPSQMTQVLSDVVDGVRGKIKAGGFQLGPDGTVPDSLKSEVISLTVWLWLTAFPKNDKLQTDGRRKNYEDALAMMEKVSSGTQRIELPDPGVVDQSIMPSISKRPHRFSHREEDGI